MRRPKSSASTISSTLSNSQSSHGASFEDFVYVRFPLEPHTHQLVHQLFANVVLTLYKADTNLRRLLKSRPEHALTLTHFMSQVKTLLDQVTAQQHAWVREMSDRSPRVAKLPNTPLHPIKNISSTATRYDVKHLPGLALENARMAQAAPNIQRMLNYIGVEYMKIRNGKK